MKPKIINAQDFQDNREKIQQQQKRYHDKHATSLPTLEEGEHVRMRDGKKWKPVTVMKNASEPRSYIVQYHEGRQYRRNRSQLLKLKNQSSLRLKDGENEVTEGIGNETNSLSSRNQEIGQAEELSKSYVTRSGRVSKPLQRLSYS